MVTQNTELENLKTNFMESITDYISGMGNTTKFDIFTLATSLYNNPLVKNDKSLQQSTSFIHFLQEQIQIGNGDILNHDLLEEVFTYILQKLMIDTGQKNNTLHQ